jgi:hypothetical protein
MADSDQLLQRNKDLEATCAHEEASIIARHQVYVITCLDPRTDPSAFLELDLGDAMVVRNAGCRLHHPAADPTGHTYSSYPRPAEMTATGEIADGKPHIQAVMAVQGDRTIGGHLHGARLGVSFARAYVIPSEYHVPYPATSRSHSRRLLRPLLTEEVSTTRASACRHRP